MSQKPQESPAQDLASPPLATSWWSRPCGGRDVLRIALPMIISTSFTSLMHFIDRLFLTRMDVASMNASMQAGLAQWVSISFAIGVVSYVNAFVAQYYGAQQPERIGLSVWQGMWIGILLTPIYLLAIPLAPVLFAIVGHDAASQALEVKYFSILALASGPCIVASAMSAYFTGRGQTWVAMVVSGIAALVNIVGDYVLIFDTLGIGISPIAGAAIATVAAHWSTVLVYGLWMYLPRSRERFGLTTGWRFDLSLMKRLIHHGGASGAHMLVEGGGFTLLVLLVGRLGVVEATATSLAFSVNIIAFIPLIGLGIAISTMVGQQLGNNRPELAERATWTGLTMGFVYSGSAALLYFFAPHFFLMAYEGGQDQANFEAIRGTVVVLLRFVALYFIFDMMQIVFACAIKGAGDTTFVMLAAGTISVLGVVIGQIGASFFGGGLYWWWSVMTCWLFALAMVYMARFLQGKWRTMRVIEHQYTGEVSDPEEDPSTETPPEVVKSF